MSDSPAGTSIGGRPEARSSFRGALVRRQRRDDILARLAQIFVERGPPTCLRSDNGPESTATAVRSWRYWVGVTTRFTEPGSPWENRYVESFDGKLRDERLSRERFETLLEVGVLIEGRRRECKQIRSHSALGHLPLPPKPWRSGPPPHPLGRREGPAFT